MTFVTHCTARYRRLGDERWSVRGEKPNRVEDFLTLSLQLDNMDTMLRHIACTLRAGDQSSVRIDKQIWPLLYTCGWTGM